MSGRRLLVIGGALVLVLGGLLLVMALLIPSERIASAAAARAEAILGERVVIGDVGLRLLPSPGVRLEGVSVGGTGGDDALATVAGLDLRARILPLFRGEVIVSRIALDAPRIRLAVDSAGVMNLPVLEADEVPRDSTARRDIRFSIDRLTVSDGAIAYTDARDGSALRMLGWDQDLSVSGETTAGALERIHLAGSLSFDAVDGELNRVIVPVHDLPVEVHHDATYQHRAQRLDVAELEVRLGDLSLGGAGSVDGVLSPDNRRASLDLQARGIDAAVLATLLPDSARARLALQDGRAITPSGTADLDLRVDGPLTPDSLPGFQGRLTVAGFGAAVDDVLLAEGVDGTVSFTADSARAELAGRILGDDVRATLFAREPAAPLLDITLLGSIDLGRLADVGLVADSLDLAGRVRSDVNGTLSLGRPEASDLAGGLTLDGVRIGGIATPVTLTEGAIALDGQRLTLERLAMTAGDTAALTVAGTLDGWIPAMLDSTASPPTFEAEVLAGVLDLDALLGPSESQYPPLLFARLQDRPLDQGPADQVAEAAGMALPALPAVEGEVRFHADHVVRNGLRYSDLDARLRVRPESVELLEATFGFMGGSIRATGLYEPVEMDTTGAPVRARLLAQFTLEGVGAQPFFDRLTPFRDHLAGEFDMAGSVDMDLDRFALPDRNTLGADGQLALSDGRLANWPALEAIAGKLGLAALDTVYFKDWIGAFQVTGSRIALQETAMDGQFLSARAAGAFGFAGDLDLGATLYLPRELASQAGAVGERILAAAGSDDRIPVGVTITGTARDPDVGIDLSEARENVVARARDAAEREARDLVERGARSALDRLEIPDSLAGLPADSLRAAAGDSLATLLPDSLAVPADSLRERAEDEIRDRLRRILP